MQKEKQEFEMNCFRRSIMHTRRRIEDMRRRAYIMRLSRNWRNVYREFVKKDAEIADLREKLQNMRIRSDTFEDKNIDKDVDIDELKAERDDWKKRAYDLATFIDEQKLELALLDQTNMELKDSSAQQKDIIEELQHELVSAGTAIERKNYALEQAIIKLETINYPDIPFSRRKVIQLCRQAVEKTGESGV